MFGPLPGWVARVANIKTRKMTREQIAAMVNNNPRAIRAWEAMVEDVSETLPNEITDVQLQALFSLHTADGSKGAANHAVALASEVLALSSACRRQAADNGALRDQIEILRAEVLALSARLSSSMARLEASVSEALTLTAGV